MRHARYCLSSLNSLNNMATAGSVPGIHATALVDPLAQIDSSVSIGPYTVIGPHVSIGLGTTIGAHCGI